MAVDWASIANAGGSLVNGILGFVLGKEQNRVNKEISQQNYDATLDAANKNYEAVEATNAMNEKLMREGWARDDTARQRMVADLENAGLSKWLAAGSSPMNSSPITLQAPQKQAPQQTYKADYSLMADALSHMYGNFLQFEQTRKQNDVLDKQGQIANEDLAIKQAEKRIKEHDANVFENRPNTASTDPSTLKYISEIVNALRGSRDSEIDNVLNNLKEKGSSAKNAVDAKINKIREDIHNGVEERVKAAQEFVAPTPKPLPGQKPMTQLEWMYQNEYKEMNLERLKQYQKYVDSFKKYHSK